MSYIVKEDLLEELGISTDCSTCPRYAGECRGHLSWLCGKIDRMPTLEVVRCKECKWQKEIYGYYRCLWWQKLTGPEVFCSIGERREDV